MDAGGVPEGVLPHDGLIGLHGEAGVLADEAAGADDVRRVDVGGQVVGVAAGADCHDHLLQGGVTGALADAVDGALDLPCPGAHRGEAVRHREPEVVVAVHRDYRLVDVADVLVDARDELVELLRRGVAHGVGNVDRRRARVDGGFE